MTALPWLDDWLPANDVPERPLMTLSTAEPDGRTVLLSEYDEHGLYFHTDSRSRKVAQLAADPRVALTFVWPEARRQLVVVGTAEFAPAAEQDRAYRNRSPYLKQLSWQNTVELAQLDHDDRQRIWSSFEPPIHPPETWIGYLVRPHRLTFWEGAAELASRRTEFTLADGEWVQSYLPG